MVHLKFHKYNKHTFILGFSIIALKLKTDGLGLIISPAVQENKL